MKTPAPLSQRKRFSIMAAVSVFLLILIVPAKHASFTSHAGDEVSTDTALDDTTFVQSSLPDSAITSDNRPVDRAGYEDGYTSGSNDAALRQHRGTYDEQNPYPSAQRDAYVQGYRQGYRHGQTFGGEHPATEARRDGRSIEDLVRESDQKLNASK